MTTPTRESGLPSPSRRNSVPHARSRATGSQELDTGAYTSTSVSTLEPQLVHFVRVQYCTQPPPPAPAQTGPHGASLFE